MSDVLHFRNHPFRFLLYLEWMLLAMALAGQFFAPHPPVGTPPFSAVSLLATIGFGLMGLWLPLKNPVFKVIYMALAIVLILLTPTAVVRRLQPFPFLYLVLVIRGCLMFRLSGRIAIAAIVYGLFIVGLFDRVREINVRVPPLRPDEERVLGLINSFSIGFAMFFGLALLFVLLLVNALLSERESREQLAIVNGQLRRYALTVEDLAMTQERNRIARDIHDSLGHSLTALNIQIEGALKLWHTRPAQAEQFLTEAKRLGSTALQDVRQSVATLRSNPLQGKPLDVAIAALTEDLQRSTGIQPEQDISLLLPLPQDVQVVLYRVTQEALTNIAKHANASCVRLQLTASDREVHLIIQDNGIGFDRQQNRTGFGLQGMQERTLALGGSVTIAAAPDQGCQIAVQIPLGASRI